MPAPRKEAFAAVVDAVQATRTEENRGGESVWSFNLTRGGQQEAYSYTLTELESQVGLQQAKFDWQVAEQRFRALQRDQDAVDALQDAIQTTGENIKALEYAMRLIKTAGA